MKRFKLNEIIFAALCCDLGLITKKLISPATNMITDFLHIPGGIGTSFSLMFLIIPSALFRKPGLATLMSFVQSLLAFALGTTGSMGILAPIGYIIPGIIIDLCMYLSYRKKKAKTSGILAASILASVCACITANIIVFRLTGIVLAVYALVSATSGSICSLISVTLVERLGKMRYLSDNSTSIPEEDIK